ncbi:extracellular solute-binding protein [Paenibacillus cremeus]|uniref:Extracellular solute-binding protein n=1 Tax=Paenibacillus cremeus TaxID=2163881 RepID=A0A559KEA2_9BACL|nr:extracellular solute-binding protein [Paenibacillus cremeus]TVY10451.1 extracellular solute-binding protein [Paenibacillus cremeus]
MKRNQRILKPLCAAVLTTALLTACGAKEEAKTGSAAAEDKSAAPLPISLVVQQVGEVPGKDSPIQQAMEKYTNTKLDFQWIPSAAFDDKINVMVASGELPKAMRLKWNASTLNSTRDGLFHEIGPLLKDYPNLSALNQMYYDNVKVDGKIYGLPLYRDIGRAGIVFRKDWMDKLGLKVPVTLDDWYNVSKEIATKDPDGNKQNDTYALFLDKSFTGPGSANTMTRLAVSQGAPNKWGMINGKMTPDFMTKEYMDTLKLFRKLYAEKLINQDFSVAQTTDNDNKWNNGKLGLRIAVASTAEGYNDLVKKSTPSAVTDVAPMTGPKGILLPGEPGNNGLYVFPKSSVKTEAELKRILKFFDQLLDAPMANLLARGIEGTHYEKADGGKVKWKDLTAFQKDVKPYRDMLPSFEVGGKASPLQNPELTDKMWKIVDENLKYSVPNPALTLNSPTYTEKGAELDNMMIDSQTKYVMGKIDDAAWQAEVDKWMKAGGSKVIDEYTAEYNKLNKK